jgi:hypothetical protein
MGRTQGEALAAQVHGSYRLLQDLEAFRLRQPRWLPFTWFRRIASRRAQRILAPAVARACPELHARVLGISQGSGLRENALWLLQAMEAIMSTVRDSTHVSPPCGCSALCVRDRMSVGGVPVIAHNFDYLASVQPFYAVRESRPAGAFRSLEFTAAPLAGTVDGVNERGLAVTCNYGHTIDDGRPAATISMRIAEVLARFETVHDAADWLTNSSRWGSGLLMLADRHGGIASVELSPTRAGVRLPGTDADHLYHTNRFHCPSTKGVEVAGPARFDARAPRPLRGRRVLESSEKRDNRFAELLSAAGPLNLEQIGNIMADHGKSGQPSDGTICMHSDYWTTTACIQCLPVARTLRVSYGSGCAVRFMDFAL